jgi:leucyl aminopeptidase
MNLFLAVGQGSSLDPKMVIMKYTPQKTNKMDPIILIGK